MKLISLVVSISVSTVVVAAQPISNFITCDDASVVAGCCTYAKSNRDQSLCYNLSNDACLTAKGPCRLKCADGSIISSDPTVFNLNIERDLYGSFRAAGPPTTAPMGPKTAISGGARRMVLDVLETLVLSVVLFLGINAVSARIRVESISMQPKLYAGDFVIVNKLAYKLGIPQRGDIIVFRYPPDPTQTPYIKRVIGLSGDQIHIADGQVYVNDRL